MTFFSKIMNALLGTTNQAVTDDNETTSVKTAQSEPHSQISQLVGEGNTKKALELLIQLQGNEDYSLQLLQKRFDKNEEDYQLKRIDFGNWMQTLAQMNHSLLQMLPQNDKKEGTISLDDISKLLKKGKIKEALQQLVKANYKNALMLQAGFNLGQKAFADKRITEQTWQLEQNRTMVAIMHTVELDKRAVEEEAPLNSKDAIRQLVANGQLEKALDLLIRTGNDEAQLLKKRLLNAQQQVAISKSDFSGTNAIRNEIAQSILNSIDPPEQKDKLKSNKVESPIEHLLVNKSTVDLLISNGQTENAFVLLQESGYPEAANLHEAYLAKKRRLNLGLLQEPEWTAFKNELYEEIRTWAYLKE